MKKTKRVWNCIEGCGSCCRLDPLERVEALQSLDDGQLEVYLSLVQEDGWCKHYNKVRKTCNIYEERPDFCHVKSIIKIYNVKDELFNAFAIKCCQQQIKSIYGSRSKVLKRFNRQIK